MSSKSSVVGKLTKILKTPIPLYLVLLIGLNIGLLVGTIEYWVLTRAQSTDDPETIVAELKSVVIPASGYTTSLVWGDLGKKLVETGAIDEAKYQQLFTSPAEGKEELDILSGRSNKPISINENNARFVLNTLWAIGLVQKSKVLDEGPMKTGGYNLENLASTAGWTLGKKSATELYSSQEIVSLNDFQQELVKKIAENVYRPCCDNPTSFPDCNHGMAALGLIALEVAAGIPEEQIYRDLLAFNSFWFPQTYIEMAAFFKNQGKSWDQVDAKEVLGSTYSSATAAADIGRQVKDLPGLDSGGSCGA